MENKKLDQRCCIIATNSEKVVYITGMISEKTTLSNFFEKRSLIKKNEIMKLTKYQTSPKEKIITK